MESSLKDKYQDLLLKILYQNDLKNLWYKGFIQSARKLL